MIVYDSDILYLERHFAHDPNDLTKLHSWIHQFLNGGKGMEKDHHPQKLTLSLWMISKLQGPNRWIFKVQSPNGWCSDIWCLHIYMSHIFGQTLEQTLVSGLRTVTSLGSEMISLQETWSHGDHHPFTSAVARYQISTSFLLTLAYLGNQNSTKKQPQKTTTERKVTEGDLFFPPHLHSELLSSLPACHAGKTW